MDSTKWHEQFDGVEVLKEIFDKADSKLVRERLVNQLRNDALYQTSDTLEKGKIAANNGCSFIKVYPFTGLSKFPLNEEEKDIIEEFYKDCLEQIFTKLGYTVTIDEEISSFLRISWSQGEQYPKKQIAGEIKDLINEINPLVTTPEKNAVSKLNEMAQAAGAPYPVYVSRHTCVNTWECTVTFMGHTVTSDDHFPKKKQAKEHAAGIMMCFVSN